VGLTVCSQDHKGGRLLVWIGDQVRLKALSSQQRALYTKGGAALYLIRNNSEPIRGKLKHKGNNKKPGNNSELRIAKTQEGTIRGNNSRSMEMKDMISR
jgi:hypothetical protein